MTWLALIFFALIVLLLKLWLLISILPIVVGGVILLIGNGTHWVKRGKRAPLWWNLIMIFIMIVATVMINMDMFSTADIHIGSILIFLLSFAVGMAIFLGFDPPTWWNVLESIAVVWAFFGLFNFNTEDVRAFPLSFLGFFTLFSLIAFMIVRRPKK